MNIAPVRKGKGKKPRKERKNERKKELVVVFMDEYAHAKQLASRI